MRGGVPLPGGMYWRWGALENGGYIVGMCKTQWGVAPEERIAEGR